MCLGLRTSACSSFALAIARAAPRVAAALAELKKSSGHGRITSVNLPLSEPILATATPLREELCIDLGHGCVSWRRASKGIHFTSALRASLSPQRQFQRRR